MPVHAAHSVRPPRRIAGLLLAVLALLCQVALGPLAPVDAEAEAQRSELAALTVLCQTNPADDGQGPVAPRHHRRPDYAPSTLATALALPCLVLAPAPVLPAPSRGTALRLVSLTSARGPPSRESHLGYPRGPPVPA